VKTNLFCQYGNLIDWTEIYLMLDIVFIPLFRNINVTWHYMDWSSL